MGGFPDGGNLRTLLVNAVKVTAALAFISYVAINWLASGPPGSGGRGSGSRRRPVPPIPTPRVQSRVSVPKPGSADPTLTASLRLQPVDTGRRASMVAASRAFASGASRVFARCLRATLDAAAPGCAMVPTPNVICRTRTERQRCLQAVTAAGYTEPTPIQAQAIPHVLARRDVLGIAQTGTGKTASFMLPMLTLLENGRARARMPRTLILEPTRELAAQVEENFEKYGKNHKLTMALLIGGVSFDDQDKKLDRGVDVLIATPGRLLDHFERGKLLLTGVEILVIDEADRMLDMGFIPDIERICKLHAASPGRRCSSRRPCRPRSQRLAEQLPARSGARRGLAPGHGRRRPSRSGWSRTGREPRRQARGAARADPRRRRTSRTPSSSATASATSRCCTARCSKHGFNAGALHGDMDQRAAWRRSTASATAKLTLLVATDVAARGLDIPAVSHVFNFDVPIHAEDYVHRIGRTGRAGRAATPSRWSRLATRSPSRPSRPWSDRSRGMDRRSMTCRPQRCGGSAAIGAEPEGAAARDARTGRAGEAAGRKLSRNEPRENALSRNPAAPPRNDRGGRETRNGAREILSGARARRNLPPSRDRHIVPRRAGARTGHMHPSARVRGVAARTSMQTSRCSAWATTSRPSWPVRPSSPARTKRGSGSADRR